MMIHAYKQNGFNIILDVHSGGVHLGDDLFYDMVTALTPPLEKDCPSALLEALSDRYAPDDILSCYSEVLELQAQGSLFSADDYQQFNDKMTPSPVKAMCLHVSHDCNLRCDYCFAGTGDYATGRKHMSAEVGKKAIDYLISKSENRRNLEIDFFGGEPLLNFDVVRQVVAYARSLEKTHNKNFRFTITTNGTLLDDDKIRFINEEMYNVVLSIDGRKEVNDRIRHRVDQSGCYDSILPKFRKLVDGRGDGQYYIRGTFTKYNLDFAQDVIHLSQCGFDQISVEPVVADPAMPYALTPEDLTAIGAEYERLAQYILGQTQKGEGFNFFHFMLDLDQGPCAIKRLRGCGSGNEYLAITPEGDVYPCHQFVGKPEWKMGSILDQSLDMEKKTHFAASTVYNKGECRDCWAKFYCSGGCNANNSTYRGDIYQPHKLSCELEKKRIECAIMLKAATLVAQEEQAAEAMA